MGLVSISYKLVCKHLTPWKKYQYFQIFAVLKAGKLHN